MFKKILVGYDGSKGGQAALQRAAVLAKGFNASLCALWVRELLPRHSDLPGEYEEEAEAADEYFKERSREVQEVAKEHGCLLYTSPSPRDSTSSRMPSSA